MAADQRTTTGGVQHALYNRQPPAQRADVTAGTSATSPPGAPRASPSNCATARSLRAHPTISPRRFVRAFHLAGVHRSIAQSRARARIHLQVAETGGPLPKELEIALVVPSFKSQYPGVYLFTTPARFLRPVLHLRTGAEELLSTFEQMYMHICCLPEAR